MNDELIHVALAVYDPSGTYSQHAGVTITSIFENTKSKVMIHILHDNTLTEDNRKKFIRTAEKYNQNIDFIDISKHSEQLSREINKFFEYKETIGTYYRLFIPEVLPYINKVLYFDCDILSSNMDIKELWDVNVEGYCFAGIHDIVAVGAAEYVRDYLNNCSIRTYINAGVLIMNLDSIRNRGNLFMNSMKWLNNHAHIMRFHDQDIINGLFYKSIKMIDTKFNIINPLQKTELKDCIIHAAGFVKAWEITGLFYQTLYWKMYLRSAWGENKSNSDLIDLMASFYVGRKDKWQLLFERIKPALKKFYWSIVPIKYIFKDIYHKLKYKIASGKYEHY